MSPAVTDPRDLRVLIPRARRAIDGPTALSSAAVSTSLNDDELLGLVADAVGNVILLTGGSSSFGYKLEVVSRDAYYLAPNSWRTDAEMIIEAQTAVIAQVAIDFFFVGIRNQFVSETIKDEGQEWTYDRSATLVRDQMKLLAEIRDRALTIIAETNQVPDAYLSYVAERDMQAATWLEPWAPEVGRGVPFSGIGGGYALGEFDLGQAWW